MIESKKLNAVITGVGMYAPDKVVDNAHFASYLDTTDEWIVTRTGIKERRYITDGATSDLAARAIDDLLKSKNMSADEIEVIIVATVTPDYAFPTTAALVQDKVGAKNAWGFDMTAACSGFLFALQTGTALIESGRYTKVVVVGADKMSAIADPSDRNTCILFGDLASAVLLEPTTETKYGIHDSILHLDGSTRGVTLNQMGGGSANPATHETVDKKWHYIYQDGKAVFKVAVKSMADVSAEIMEKNNLKPEDVAYLVPHQANMRIIEATANRMGVGMEKVCVNIHKYGNTTGGTIPSCITEYYRDGKIKKGDNLILAAFGAGYSWGSIYLTWGID